MLRGKDVVPVCGRGHGAPGPWRGMLALLPGVRGTPEWLMDEAVLFVRTKRSGWSRPPGLPVGLP